MIWGRHVNQFQSFVSPKFERPLLIYTPELSRDNRPEQSENNKRPKFGVLTIILPVSMPAFALLSKHIPIVHKLMPIVINNARPCINFFLGLTKDQNDTMIMRMDSDAAINTGNKI